MDSFQLRHLTTDDLLLLKENVATEIRFRKKTDAVLRRIQHIKSLPVNHFTDMRDLNKEIAEHNRKKLLHIPSLTSAEAHNKKKYLMDLIHQDWSFLYPCEESTGEFYVYVHVDPRERVFVCEELLGGNYGGKPFYVGKGSKNRAWDLKRNQGHGLLIKQICADGYSAEHIVKILFENLSEQKALEIESKLIYFFGLTYDKTRTHGWLVNLDVPKMPDFAGTMLKYPSKNHTHRIEKVAKSLARAM